MGMSFSRRVLFCFKPSIRNFLTFFAPLSPTNLVENLLQSFTTAGIFYLHPDIKKMESTVKTIGKTNELNSQNEQKCHWKSAVKTSRKPNESTSQNQQKPQRINSQNTQKTHENQQSKPIEKPTKIDRQTNRKPMTINRQNQQTSTVKTRSANDCEAVNDDIIITNQRCQQWQKRIWSRWIEVRVELQW
jgi:flagellar biosynthesis GTPase FlhF